jgi:hypothetical protein
MAEDCAFQAQKWCGSKPLSTTPKSRALTTPYPTVAGSFPLLVKTRPDPKEGSTNEQGMNFAASKPHSYSMANPKKIGGRLLVIESHSNPDEDRVNEKRIDS